MNCCFTVIYVGSIPSSIIDLSRVLMDQNIKFIDVKAFKIADTGAAIALIDRRMGRFENEAEIRLKIQSLVLLALVNEIELQRKSLFDEGFLDYVAWPLLKSELAFRLKTAYMEALRRGPPVYCTDPLVDKACQIMVQNLEKKVTLQDILREIGTSRTTLIARFNEFFNCGPLTWLRNQRMAEAARILSSETYPIATIAAAVGYDDSNNFSTSFRKFFGTSPKSYRKNNKNINTLEF